MKRISITALALIAGLAACEGESREDDATDDDTEQRVGTTLDAGLTGAGSDGGRLADAGSRRDSSVAPDASSTDACASLTYASFGEAFLDKYCATCHQGRAAPDGIDLSTLAGVAAHKREIDAHAVKTPRSKPMPPPTSPQPTADERKKLGQWLTCGPR